MIKKEGLFYVHHNRFKADTIRNIHSNKDYELEEIVDLLNACYYEDDNSRTSLIFDVEGQLRNIEFRIVQNIKLQTEYPHHADEIESMIQTLETIRTELLKEIKVLKCDVE